MFALASVPLVAWSLVQPPADWQQRIVNVQPLGVVSAIVLATVSALTASLVGGTLGDRFVRSRPVHAVLIALGTAWPVGIGMLSITAAVLGIPLRKGILCIDTCTASVTDEQALSGFASYPNSLLGAAVLVVPVVAFIVLLVVGVWLAKRGRPVLAILFTVAAYAAVHMWSISLGGGVAFACLALGVIVWAIAFLPPKGEQPGPEDMQGDPTIATASE